MCTSDGVGPSNVPALWRLRTSGRGPRVPAATPRRGSRSCQRSAARSGVGWCSRPSGPPSPASRSGWLLASGWSPPATHGGTAREAPDAEPGAAADGGGMSAFPGFLAHSAPPLLSWVVRPLRRFTMLSPGVPYTTAALLGLVAAACTALCLAWSVPAWRRQLAPAGGTSGVNAPAASALSGWPARVGGGLVSTGIGAVALVAWYGLYCTLTAI